MSVPPMMALVDRTLGNARYWCPFCKLLHVPFTRANRITEVLRLKFPALAFNSSPTVLGGERTMAFLTNITVKDGSPYRRGKVLATSMIGFIVVEAT